MRSYYAELMTEVAYAKELKAYGLYPVLIDLPHHQRQAAAFAYQLYFQTVAYIFPQRHFNGYFKHLIQLHVWGEHFFQRGPGRSHSGCYGYYDTF